MSGSTSTSAAATQTSQKTGPSSYEPAALGVHVGAADQLAAGEAEVPAHERDVLVRVRLAAGDLRQLGPQVLGGPHHGQAGDGGRAARAGGAVVGREAGVGARASGRSPTGSAQHLGGDLRHHRARALADLGRADVDRDLAVGLEPHGGARDRVGAGRQHADREATARPSARARAPQPSASATFSTSPTRSASSGLPPGRTISPGRSRLRRRISRGSMPRRRAIWSTCCSPAHCMCTAPKARYEPAGEVLV